MLFLPLVAKGNVMEKESNGNPNKHKGGRPRQAVKRCSATGIRFTKAEYFIVKSKANKANLKLTEYIRSMAVNGNVIARFTAEEKDNMRQLAGMANNLNQIARLANKERLLSAAFELEKIRVGIDQLLEHFRR